MNKLFDFDKKNNRAKFLVGTDEAGRGPLAGPVVAAAVCFPEVNKKLREKLALLNDSKKLSEKTREYLYDVIIDNSIYHITPIGVDEIEKINILQSALKAMRLSCQNVIKRLGEDIEVFVDGNKLIPKFSYNQTTIVHGDATSASIAAASILAKVYRDRLMYKYSQKYPDYHFEKNKGYGTKKHVDALLNCGACPIHRQSFIRNILECNKAVQLTLEIK